MYYVKQSNHNFEDACDRLEKAVAEHDFSVLGVHDLGEKLRSKGQAFDEQCKVFEVCNPGQAAKVLAADMKINMALPCRISVYTEKGATRIGMIRPRDLLAMLSDKPELEQVADEVEQATIRMIDEAC
ncbi:MAG: DUF302 domain-containing protein [Wenzhouxiangellaceae bacterium]|nr:DUF302 domain-containing protein [Wenzhouxiangellaceae bacterium]